MPEIAFSWAPIIALGCGAIASLGMIRSVKTAFWLGVAVLFLQIAFWMTILMSAPVEDPAGESDWNPSFAVSFIASLIAVAPYTMIGEVVGGALVALGGGNALQEAPRTK
jgi:hypothetical protein